MRVVTGGFAVRGGGGGCVYSGILASRKIPLIIDCGANIGGRSLWFKMRYPTSKIVAVEPAPDNLELLKRNCLPEKIIDVVEAGIGPEDSDAFLQDNGGGGWGFQTSKRIKDVRINIFSLKNILNKNSEKCLTA